MKELWMRLLIAPGKVAKPKNPRMRLRKGRMGEGYFKMGGGPAASAAKEPPILPLVVHQ